jgi:hypothetical protein
MDREIGHPVHKRPQLVLNPKQVYQSLLIIIIISVMVIIIIYLIFLLVVTQQPMSQLQSEDE